MAGLLTFDGECGFCTRARDVIHRLDRRHRIQTLPAQHPDATKRTGRSVAELTESVWWIDEDGSSSSGAAAVNAALSAALGSRLPIWLYRLPGSALVQNRCYRWVAKNRHRLPGTVPWCQQHPEDCHSGNV